MGFWLRVRRELRKRQSLGVVCGGEGCVVVGRGMLWGGGVFGYLATGGRKSKINTLDERTRRLSVRFCTRGGRLSVPFSMLLSGLFQGVTWTRPRKPKKALRSRTGRSDLEKPNLWLSARRFSLAPLGKTKARRLRPSVFRLLKVGSVNDGKLSFERIKLPLEK